MDDPRSPHQLFLHDTAEKLISPRSRIEAPSPTARPERGPGRSRGSEPVVTGRQHQRQDVTSRSTQIPHTDALDTNQPTHTESNPCIPLGDTQSHSSKHLVPMGSHTVAPNPKQLVPMGSRTVVPNPVPLNNLFLWVTIKWYQTLHL